MWVIFDLKVAPQYRPLFSIHGALRRTWTPAYVNVSSRSRWIKYRVSTETQGNITTEVYQVSKMHHKKFPDPLNVVCILKTHLPTEKKSHVLLFSSDLAVDAEKMIDYYSLRFQIEFNFRDAKQYWGLEDFMNVNKTPVNNAANLSMFMVNVSAKLLAPLRLENTESSVLDLKAHYRGMKYLRETLKPQKPDAIHKLLNGSVQSVLFIRHPLKSIHHNLAKVLRPFRRARLSQRQPTDSRCLQRLRQYVGIQTQRSSPERFGWLE